MLSVTASISPKKQGGYGGGGSSAQAGFHKRPHSHSSHSHSHSSHSHSHSNVKRSSDRVVSYTSSDINNQTTIIVSSILAETPNPKRPKKTSRRPRRASYPGIAITLPTTAVLPSDDNEDDDVEGELQAEEVRIPTDRLGRIRKDIDLRDYRPPAPRNTTQELMVRKKKILSSSLSDIDDLYQDVDLDLGAIQEFGSMVPFHKIIRRKLCDSCGSDEDSKEEEEEEEDVANEEDPLEMETFETPSTGDSTQLSGTDSVTATPTKGKRKHWSDELNYQNDPTSNILMQWIQEQEEVISRLSKENKKLRKELSLLSHPMPSISTSTS